ncbi:MAG: sigma-E factor negative regulatory protein [Pseudomonadales bacterium]|uniref:Sigma factor algU negative regulatory protein MucA n=1 Tax=Oleiphilus messinensis TaxID=141451 RepID=A0A1Y0I508_9GAMM|nr:sigma-E factor negative regulatory protein [Oleiphilus messinensis]ARU55320.1 sigma factor algU negative regulatory protein MucA [Oleiphilus messinensis]MCG8611980.1 sigma-E factor negative regulatory protein [Pseudomonadales bacterium]
MDERLKESISALFDNEAEELETRRVLASSDDRVLHQWKRYQQMSELIQTNSQAFDLSQRVSAAIADVEMEPVTNEDALTTNSVDPAKENTDQIPVIETNATGNVTHSSNTGHRKGYWGAAIAASISFFFVFGAWVSLQGSNPASDGQQLVQSDPALQISDEDVALVELRRQTEQPVATVANTDHDREALLDTEGADRLNDYLMRHAENGVMGAAPVIVPFARVASFNDLESSPAKNSEGQSSR